MRLLAIIALLLFAGCFSSVNDEPQLPLYLGADHTMGAAVEESLVPLNWGFPEYFSGQVAPVWTTTFDTDVLIMNATAKIVYEATQPTTHTDTRPPLTVWFGSQSNWVDHAFHAGPAQLQPGERATANWELRLPNGGLVVPKGESLDLRVGSYYTNGLALVAGASELDLTTVAISLPAFKAGETTTYIAEVAGAACMSRTPADSFTFQYNATGPYRIDVTHSPSPMVDVDIAVTSNGTYLHGSHGSANDEAVIFYPQNLLVPGVHDIIVYACQPMATQFTVTITKLI